jgi:glycosyltransferase involved in cell wall biosynthesis
MPKLRTLTVVCPVYEEEAVIAEFQAELGRVLATLSGWTATTLFVVDRGSDRTLDILRNIAARDRSVRVLSLSARFGQQMALRAGLDHSHSDAVVMMDSDLQHPPSLIPSLLAGIDQGYDIVYTIREDAHDLPLLKRLGSRGFYRLINAVSATRIPEGAADFRVITRRVAELFRRGLPERRPFLRGLFAWVGFRSLGVRYKPGKRRAGRTKYSLGAMVRLCLDAIVSFSRVPLQLATPVGLLFFGVGLAWGLAELARWGLGRASASGWEIVAILLGVLGGLQLVFLGIRGEYLGAVLDEARARPHYIVEEKINFEEAPAGGEGRASA